MSEVNAGVEPARWLHLSIYVALLFAVSATFAARKVSAELSEWSLEVGRRLDETKHILSGSSSLRLNGQRLRLNSSSTEQSVSAVLDRFASLCARESGGVKEELEQLLQTGKALPPGVEPKSFGMLRTDGEREGAAACFVRNGAGGLSDFAARLLRAAETGDFAELGQLRYVFARRREGAATTHVISVWTLDAIPLERMFPGAGDAPGRDLFEGARPPASRRVISAELEGSDHHAVIYQAAGPVERALSGFDAPLKAQGFVAGDLSRVAGLSPVPTRVYLKRDAIVLVLAEAGEQNTNVTAFRLQNGGFVSSAP